MRMPTRLSVRSAAARDLRLLSWALLAALLVVGACGSKTGLDVEGAPADLGVSADAGADAHRDAGVDSRIDADADAPPPNLSPPAPPDLICTARDAGIGAGATCTRPLTVTAFKRSSPSCYVDTGFDVGSEGVLTYPCAGGVAAIIFAAHTFEGVVIDGLVDVCVGTTFPWSDGCTWQSTQRVEGSAASGPLTLTYAEAPAAGQSCASPCTASALISFD